MIPILILAAGAASRMRGVDKLGLTIGGVPLLRRQVQRAVATGQPVLVCLPDPGGARAAQLAGLDVQRVAVPDAAEGLSASLRAGVAALPELAGAVMVLLADLPEIETEDLAALLAEASCQPGRILRGATETGQPGHPVLFPAGYFAELRQSRGDEGARGLLMRLRDQVALVPLPGQRALTDLDTPEAWAAWRARTGQPD